VGKKPLGGTPATIGGLARLVHGKVGGLPKRIKRTDLPYLRPARLTASKSRGKRSEKFFYLKDLL